MIFSLPFKPIFRGGILQGVVLQSAVVGALVLLTGCQGGLAGRVTNYVPALVKPYRTDIQQGNFVSAQEVERLQVGMSKDQVRFILGTPLHTSTFHANRWDYLYRLSRGDGKTVQYQYTVEFENDRLVRFGGQDLPQDQAEFFTGRPAPTPPASKP